MWKGRGFYATPPSMILHNFQKFELSKNSETGPYLLKFSFSFSNCTLATVRLLIFFIYKLYIAKTTLPSARPDTLGVTEGLER